MHLVILLDLTKKVFIKIRIKEKGEVTVQYKGYETLYYVMQYYKNELI